MPTYDYMESDIHLIYFLFNLFILNSKQKGFAWI